MIRNKSYPYYHNKEIYTLKDFLNYCCKNYRKNNAFVFEENKKTYIKTYNDFSLDIDSLGAYICKKEYNQEKIAILGENSYEWILSYFSIANSRNIVVPLDKDLNIKSIENILRDTGAKMLFYSDTYNDYADELKKSDLNIELVNMKKILNDIIPSFYVQKERIQKFRNIIINPDDLIAILYTSGTTGVSKGVMITHKNICVNVTSGMKSLKMYGTTILALPLHHSYAFSGDVLCVMFWGCKNYINKSLKNLNKDILSQKPNFILTVPLMVETFYKKIWINAKNSKKDILLNILISISNVLLFIGMDFRKKIFKSVLNAFGSNLDMIVCGGASLDKKYQSFFRSVGIHIVMGYGITECSPFIAVNRNSYSRDGSAGLPLTCSTVKIDNKEGEREGEILAKGDMVMKGYYNNPILTSEVIKDGYFRTGDMGYQDKDGFIYITGRKKNVIILSNGKNVYPEELEFILIKNEAISEVIVKEGKNKNIVAEIYPNEEFINKKNIADKNLYFKKYLNSINKTLPLYKNINDIELRNTEFEKTTTKKIKRNYVNKI